MKSQNVSNFFYSSGSSFGERWKLMISNAYLMPACAGHDGKLCFSTFYDAINKDDGVAKSRRQRSYRAFSDARNSTCMTSHLKKHDALYMAIFA
jgi:hypothetical protein